MSKGWTGPAPDFGAFVVSLDFEIHWGVRDHASATGPYRDNLLGVWQAVPRMLELFRRYEIAATWATVGLLFARDRTELEGYFPSERPRYRNARLYPYDEPTGKDEADDPLHFAPSLIEAIRQVPRQEIATHTLSHYYCLEPGQTADAFREDLRTAMQVAQDRGIEIRSIVFPRNQTNPLYHGILREAGIMCSRGNPRAWMHRVEDSGRAPAYVRAARLLDTYLDLAGAATTPWREVVHPESGLCDVPASCFLRPYAPRLRRFEELRFERIADGIRKAAAEQQIYHLWWHPHNFGIDLEENLAFLARVLEVVEECRASSGLRSLSMAEAAEIALAARRERV
jgi:hypothetical protein